MLTNAQKRTVVSIWGLIEDEYDDISTEQLFALTCERASDQLGVTIDDGDVADALAKFALKAVVNPASHGATTTRR